MIVVLDCNIWLSFAITDQLAYIDQLDNIHGVSISTCKQLINELTVVLLRPKFSKYLTIEAVEKMLYFHQSITKTYILKDIPSVVTDIKDDYLFALCNISKADYFVTGDKLLLAVGTYNKTKVISLADFKTLINIYNAVYSVT